MSGPKASSHTVVVSTRRSWAAWEKRAIVDEAQRATQAGAVTPAPVRIAQRLKQQVAQVWSGLVPVPPARIPEPAKERAR